jgi:hypothetical protein
MLESLPIAFAACKSMVRSMPICRYVCMYACGQPHPAVVYLGTKALIWLTSINVTSASCACSFLIRLQNAQVTVCIVADSIRLAGLGPRLGARELKLLKLELSCSIIMHKYIRTWMHAHIHRHGHRRFRFPLVMRCEEQQTETDNSCRTLM